ncbi:dihydrolipoyl dehydrogenase [Paracidovorax valerianellae]|uniref:Dihydrolipoamide dehydrogenase n=1 Tax=Paracidovorax valerianellae TaxID=187868 RepID=A0A1G6IAY8_9BURK|nr:dihydrolipoyl dehydrogenase [Paracidovorax valerianellae]MDA8447958.1 dihydrolipoyl dehydrogenase [Paracidovorax valerianellae]SDC03608.1 dihydrolipoamide dehydrogenase [Paracidovorax valerianellae]
MSQPLDAIIIGAGSAGLAALREVRKRTDRVLIVNDGPWGTTCARVGCMPSKMLIEAANAYHRRLAFETFGIRGKDGLTVDMPAVLRRVRALRDDFVAGTEKASAVGKQGISGRARLQGPNTVEVGGQTYEARSIIIATGSRPIIPEEWLAFGDRILTTDTLFEQPTLGPRIAVIGLGPLGAELAQALSRLGVEVAAFSTGPSLAGVSDPDINETLQALLKEEFVVNVGDEARLREVPGGIEVSNGSATVVVDQVLAALGRRPNLEHLGLDTLGVELDEHGKPPVDARSMQIGNLPVFMAGDADDRRPLLHEASDEGHIAALNAVAAEPQGFRRRTPLSIVFTQPNAAVVGSRWKDLKKGDFVTGSVDFSRQGRARAAQHNHGRLKVYAEQGTGRILGAEMCAPSGEHMAHLMALAIDRSLTVQDMLRMPFYHPVLEEGLRTALRDAASHLPRASDSDLSACSAYGASALD